MLCFSDACERNKEPILRILTTAFAHCTRALEIGSGTGQHAVHFTRYLPHLAWQPTDMSEQLLGLRERIEQEGPDNLLAPLELDVRVHPWPIAPVDAIFSANTLHIMAWEGVQHFFRGAGATLKDGGVLCVYGPFRYAGRYTSDSNAAFDRHLQARDPASRIRDFEAVDRLAQDQGMTLQGDHAMPANNQMLVWRKLNAPQASQEAETRGSGVS